MANWKAGLFGLTVLLTACGSSDDGVLKGDRLDASGDPIQETVVAPTSLETPPGLSLRAAKANASWTHLNGSAQHWIAHPALSASLSEVWQTSIGAKDTKRNRTTAVPVAANGRLFTMDSLSNVTALTPTGGVLWQRNLAPALDDPREAGGGGLAVDDAAVYATTGAGVVFALDPANGDTLWDQDLESFGGSAPTVYDELVYLSARDGAAWAIEKDNGRIRWQVAGPSVTSSFVGGPGPAITSKWALFPFGTGEILSTYREGGLRNWTSSVTGGRTGTAVSIYKDIIGDPVIVGDKVFVGTASGPTVALDLIKGERVWTSTDGVFDSIWAAGNSVFFVNDENRLMRVSASTGATIWSVPLPRFTTDKVRRRKGVHAHFGPVVAGGRLIVASSDGLVRLFDPETGRQSGSLPIKGGAASAPVVVDRTLYVQSRDGKLHAYR